MYQQVKFMAENHPLNSYVSEVALNMSFSRLLSDITYLFLFFLLGCRNVSKDVTGEKQIKLELNSQILIIINTL